ncbi:hypothetical protein T439DRAFT_378208 [Meredithblackwellia eburnea MCA 4105]
MTQIPDRKLSLSSSSPIPRPPLGRMAAGQAKVESALDFVPELLELPSVQKASFLNGDNSEFLSLQLEYSTRSISQLNKRTSTQTLTLSASTGTVISTSPVVLSSSDVVLSLLSPDGSKSAMFRKNSGKEGSRKLSVEIWDSLEAYKLHEIDLGDDHGDFYVDDTFGPPSWHPNGHSLVYVAEAPKPKSTPEPKLDQYKYDPDYGEKFTGKKLPTVFLLVLPGSPFAIEKTAKPAIHRLTHEDLLKNTGFGQPVLLPSDESPRVLVLGYSALGDLRKLGIVFCSSRPAALYELEMWQVKSKKKNSESNDSGSETEGVKKTATSTVWKAGAAIRQSPPGRSIRSARVYTPPPGVKGEPLLVFLSNRENGPHASCGQLHAVRLGSGSQTVLVPEVGAPKTLAEFPGLYVEQLPQKPFLLADGVPHVVLSSLWRSRRVPLAVSLKTGEVRNLAPWPTPSDDPVLPYLATDREKLLSISVLGTDGNSRILGIRSGPFRLPEVVLLNLNVSATEWKTIRKPRLSAALRTALTGLDWTVFPLPKFEPTEVILLSPCAIDPAAEAALNLPPLITIPHGGPHSAFATDYAYSSLIYVLAGYRVALVNYPGSLGFGQDAVLSLPPQVGKLDVDATLATSHFLNTISLASRTPGSRLLMGGSHGGYISTHLSATDEYDAVVLRNPVTDLASMAAATDIPDWTFIEAAFEYSFEKPPAGITVDEFTHLREVSPLTKASKVKVPTLLLVGEVDRRVPPDQSRNWYHALKANGTEVEMYTFPENSHGLDSTVEAELLVIKSGLRFIARYTTF